MKVTRILAALTLVAGFAGSAHAAGCSRLSWGTCDPWVENTNFSVPQVYRLVWSITGTGDTNAGTDGIIHIGNGGGLPVPDCWHFDDAGCQTGSQLGLNHAALSKACPVFQGLNSLQITNYAYDLQGQAELRLSNTYDLFTPNPANRYTVWFIDFNHSFSSTGPTPPDMSTCGGAEQAENANLTYAEYLTTTNQLILMPSCDSDPAFPPNSWPQASPGSASGFSLWNGGVAPVATHAATWGAVKGLYH